MIAAASYNTPQHSDLSSAIRTSQCQQWVDSTYDAMTDREKVAQLFVPHIVPTDGASSKALIRRLVEDDGVGGLLFTSGSIDQYAEMTDYAQSVAKVPIFMTLDGEWGLAMRVADTPRYPKNMALGAIQDERLLYAYGQEIARQCRAIGVNVNFAPVLDVNSNPENPVIGMRSFGSDPRRVAKLGSAYAVGMEDGRVLSVAKHFPGHGDTSSDSHKTLPLVSHDRATLDSLELYPFKKYIASGCNGVMVGHISVPALDSAGVAASMSPEITSDLLKGKMLFDGLVFTDGLGMRGADVKGNKCVEAFKAGADVLLSPPQLSADIDALYASVKSGEVPMSRIEESCKKILAYKYMLGLSQGADSIDLANVASKINDDAAFELERKLCDAAVTVLGKESKTLPIGNLASNKIAIVSIGADKHNEFSNLCRKYADVDLYVAGQLTNAKICDYDIVVAAVMDDSQGARSEIDRLSQARAFVPVLMVNPYQVSKYNPALTKAAAIVLTYEDTPALRRSAAKALFAGIDVSGKLPVDIAGVGQAGDGVDYPKTRLGYGTWAGANMDPQVECTIDSLINAAMADGAFPGCQILVARNGEVLMDRSYGKTTKGGNPVTGNTLYDLASVSKTVGTLPGVMKAYDLGLFGLDQAASTYLPELDMEGKADITPRMLLYHQTGLAPSLGTYDVVMDSTTYSGKLLTSRRDTDHTIKIYDKLYGHKAAKMRSDIYRTTPSKEYNIEVAKGIYASQATYDTIMSRIYQLPVRDNRNYLYSCLNFALLMEMEQRLTGIPHQDWVADSIWAPIGAYGFCYRPTETHEVSEIAATEKDNYLRKQHLRGYVHDEMCAFAGGVFGNAGVFGTANDIAKLCQAWLNGGWYGDKRIFSRATNHLFTTDKSPTCRRGLGFDKPDVENLENSPCCDEASASVFGHTGYTGTCYWVDPEYQLIYIFLDNRVDPTRNNAAWTRAAIRPAIMSALYNAIND